MCCEEKTEKKLNAAFRAFLNKICTYIQRSKQQLYIYFYLEHGRLKSLKPFAHVQKVLI